MVNGMFTQTNYLLASKMLDATALRHEALASNLANLETKGYQRVDLAPDFGAQLNDAVMTGSARRIQSLQPKIQFDSHTPTLRSDGNNVELDSELMAINRNALNQEFLTQYMTGQYSSLRAAIASHAE